jgi:hypothetical protein
MPSNKKTKRIKKLPCAPSWQDKEKYKDIITNKDRLVIGTYTVKCQKCEERFPFVIRFVDEGAKKIAHHNLTEIKVYSRQFKIKKETILSPANVLSDTNHKFDIERLIKERWRKEKKDIIRRIYAQMNGSNKEQIMCDTCYQIHKLQE